jgi:hypothetical protein
MDVLFNGNGWSSFEILAYILLIGYALAPVICIVVFILRKNKFWFNYLALAGELIFFLHLLFHVQHYPWQWELSIIGTPLLLVAFIATLWAVKKEKIPASAKLGLILCLYILMMLNLSQDIFNHTF